MEAAAQGSAMDRVSALARVLENDPVRAWKEAGGAVVGYACVATPPEIMAAAGVLPYRLRALGNSQTQIADAHLSRFNCSFCRSCLQLGLDGSYSFLDGLVESNGCDHLRGMFENWQYSAPVPFFHYVKVPHETGDDALDYYTGELELFRDALRERFGSVISDEDILAAMDSQEAVREALRGIDMMRARSRPAFTGLEALELYLVSSAVPAADFLELAGRAAKERQNHGVNGYRARLMLCGAATDELELVAGIEDVGGLVVADAFCFGARAFSVPLRRDIEPVRALAEASLGGMLCPRMYADFSRRRDFVLQRIEMARVDGVVAMHNKFCDIHGVDNVQLRLDLEKRGVPVLQLEKEYGSGADIGRVRTRVQAFLERIGGHE